MTGLSIPSTSSMVPVTKPFLPPLEEYNELLRGIWSRHWLTNHGPLVSELERELTSYLGVEETFFVANGTMALQIAIKALGICGEVITTPFSYVATTSSLVWEGLTPVMVDIDPSSFNLNPVLIEAAITERTTAILATHVFGNPCQVDAIGEIAQKHDLPVIYDAAHSFGTSYNGRSLFTYGDVATASFHATKLFHTVEGGAIFARHPDVRLNISRMRNFGHVSPTEFDRVGVNGKNSELHAAFGLVNLRYLEEILEQRRVLCTRYDALLGNRVQRQRITSKSKYNFAYYPILVRDESVLLSLIAALSKQNIIPRRYFYPSLSGLPYLSTRAQTPVADDIASRVLCLPLYHTLTSVDQDRVCDVILSIV